MRIAIIFSLAIFLSLACSKIEEAPVEVLATISPEAYMDQNEQSIFVYSISRYICHYPSQVTEQNKWESRFDDVYLSASKNYTLEAYYIDSLSGRHYYMVSRPGRSIYEKYVALAGTFVPTSHDAYHDYEEVFRTWKLFPDEHQAKSEMLFRKFIRGNDLGAYQIQHTQPEEYIEFPDSETWYDKEARIWVTSRGDIFAPYRIW